MADEQKKRYGWKIALVVILLLVVVLGAVGWYKFFREEPQPDWVTATPDMRFKYGSIGAEHDAGLPYWIFFVLPRMFPEKLPGPGGYASLGVAWEQGQELPIGSPKKWSASHVWQTIALPATRRVIARARMTIRCSFPPVRIIRSIFRPSFVSPWIAPKIRASTRMRS